MRPLHALILATATALKTCKVQDLATRRVAGALLAPFGGRAGAGQPRRNAAGALCTSRHRAALAVGTWAALAWNLAPICC